MGLRSCLQDRKRFAQSLKRNVTCLLFLSSLFPFLHAQKIPFQNFTIQNGLPQNTVLDIDQDHQGYIWFATQVGAVRFDGYEFELFNSDNGLPDDYVNCLMVDANGHVWMGTENGIAVYNGNGFLYYSKDNGLVDNRVDALLEDKSGNVWITTAYGLSVLTADSMLSYTQDDALEDNSIIDMYVDSRGRVHVATFPGLTLFERPDSFSIHHKDQIIRDIIETGSGEIWYATQENGILVLSGSEEKYLAEQEGLRDSTVFSLLEDHQGRIWCGTYLHGIFRFEEGRFQPMFTETPEFPIVAEMFEDNGHRIWFRTFEDGIWLYNEGNFRHITVANNLVHNNVNDVFEDKYGNIWFGTVAGVSKYGRVIFEIFDTDMGLPENHITSVYRDSRDRIWFGTYGSLLYKDQENTYTLGTEIGFDEDAMPLCFAESREGPLYIGTDYGLYAYNGDSVKRIVLDVVSDVTSINYLLNTSDSDLWCATDSGILILRRGEEHLLEMQEGMTNVQVNSMALFGSRVACATEAGVFVLTLSEKHIASFTTEDGLASDVCIDIAFDDSGNIWVATNRGISRIAADLNSEITSFNMEKGLRSNTTYFVEFSENQDLWIGTERGINVIDAATKEVEYYGIEDGFYPLETNARAVSRGTGGELWIGTVEGLVVYNPMNDYKDLTPPDLILFPPEVEGEVLEESHKYDFHARGEKDVLLLPYTKNSLKFTYTGIHTTSPNQNSFSYKLEGFDSEWSLPVRDRSVSYERLPVGSYTFRLKAFNLDGISSRQEARFAFTIQPPFWKTPWFIILEVLTGLLLVVAIVKIRERQLVREKRVLETKVKERTREIEEQKLEIEAQRDHIFSQNKEITDSIHYAKRIQQAVLPGKQILERSLPEHFIFFKPRDIVSGDFYWVEEKDGLIIVCAADCTGHGVPGAFMSLLGLTFLNEIVNKDGITHADQILNRLRSYIIAAMSNQSTSGETKDGMDLALAVFDLDRNQLEFSGAYNPLIVIRAGEIIEYKADKMPIGKHVGPEEPFRKHVIPLQKQDMIFLFSDGFQDQFGGERDAKYKTKPFKRLLQKISPEPAEVQATLLGDELEGWKGNAEQVDDILILGIKFTKS